MDNDLLNKIQRGLALTKEDIKRFNEIVRKRYSIRYPNQKTIGKKANLARITVSLWFNGKNCIGMKKLLKLYNDMNECD